MAKLTVDKKKQVLDRIYDEQINRQQRNIKKGTYTMQKGTIDVLKMGMVHNKRVRLSNK